MNTGKEEIIIKAYQAFNKRDIDAVLSLMTMDVHWPNGWEGGYVDGHEAVKNYWTRQWKEIDPYVTPVAIKILETDKVEVEVHQVVKDKSGNLLFDGIVRHIYSFKNDLITGMEIENPGALL